ncbi:MAG: DUF7550 family protein [Halodesulfurarchaeum sp.]
MTGENGEEEVETEGNAEEEVETEEDIRVTAPMQAFESREVLIGMVVFGIGLLLTFVIPLLG